MLYLPFLLAFRYLQAVKSQKSIATMVIASFSAIAIGSFALALVLAIMDGFEKATHAMLQNVQPTLIIQAAQQLDIQKITAVLDAEFPEIVAISPTCLQHAIIKRPDGNDITHVIALKGIVPEKEALTTALEKKIINAAHEKTLVSTITNNTILIGYKLAESLNVTIGDTLEIVYAPTSESTANRISLEQWPVTIGGIFKTGIEEFDNDVAICSLALIEQLFDQGPNTVGLQSAPNVNQQKLIQKLKERLHLDVYSWKDLYPALVAALRLEKYASVFIISLIILVASMSIMSLLFMLITQKRGDIAILKAMGMPQQTIQQIFLIIGMMITTVATIVGLIGAWLIGLLLKNCSLFTLPDIYYVSQVPVSLEISLFLIVFSIVMLLSFLATWFAIKRTDEINIAQVLRFEA